MSVSDAVLLIGGWLVTVGCLLTWCLVRLLGLVMFDCLLLLAILIWVRFVIVLLVCCVLLYTCFVIAFAVVSLFAFCLL